MRPIFFISALITASVFSISAVGIAIAQQPEPRVDLGFQREVALDEELVLWAYLLDPAGNPIRRAEIIFTVDVSFMNTLNRMELSRETTDDEGLAQIMYRPKLDGDLTITARFVGNEIFAPAESSEQLSVSPGGDTYVEEAPFRVPGADIRIMTTVIIILWGMYFYIVWKLWLVSRASPSRQPSEEAQ